MREGRVVIVGGGAAGLAAAVSAARSGARVTLLEAGARVGRKILASGNGRCNLSNLGVAPAAYNDPGFVSAVLGEFPCESIRSFFRGLGLLSYADAEGRIYPVTNAANSVLDVLRLECAHLGVEERCGFEVAHVQSEPGSGVLTIFSPDGSWVSADAVIVATGGGASVLADIGHKQTPYTPALVPLVTEQEPIRGLSGVRVRCAASLIDADGQTLATERGELLFRDYGVSGIMVFDLSRAYVERSTLSIDLFPDIELAEMERLLIERHDTLGWRTAGGFFDGMLHTRVAQAVLRAAGASSGDPASTIDATSLAAIVKDFRLGAVGRGEVRQAQVTRGGACVEGFDAATLASDLVSGVFAAGEVLDIDGRCGGFNLHWAWGSGIVAGRGAAAHATGVPA
ncbi:MAG: aminoacetone oxidase family FAD-binding enzyme [Coriobacteriia bacterium]|nr:aminoacetone oxidase family FAD-binding enzyme [Coriobacteriia bacterium]